MNGNNSFTLGLYRRLMTCFVRGHGQKNHLSTKLKSCQSITRLKQIFCHNFSKMMYICNCIVHVSRYIMFFPYAVIVNCCIHVFTLFPHFEHPAVWICAHYKSLLLLLLLLLFRISTA